MHHLPLIDNLKDAIQIVTKLPKLVRCLSEDLKKAEVYEKLIIANVKCFDYMPECFKQNASIYGLAIARNHIKLEEVPVTYRKIEFYQKATYKSSLSRTLVGEVTDGSTEFNTNIVIELRDIPESIRAEDLELNKFLVKSNPSCFKHVPFEFRDKNFNDFEDYIDKDINNIFYTPQNRRTSELYIKALTEGKGEGEGRHAGIIKLSEVPDKLKNKSFYTVLLKKDSAFFSEIPPKVHGYGELCKLVMKGEGVDNFQYIPVDFRNMEMFEKVFDSDYLDTDLIEDIIKSKTYLAPCDFEVLLHRYLKYFPKYFSHYFPGYFKKISKDLQKSVSKLAVSLYEDNIHHIILEVILEDEELSAKAIIAKVITFADLNKSILNFDFFNYLLEDSTYLPNSHLFEIMEENLRGSNLAYEFIHNKYLKCMLSGSFYIENVPVIYRTERIYLSVLRRLEVNECVMFEDEAEEYLANIPNSIKTEAFFKRTLQYLDGVFFKYIPDEFRGLNSVIRIAIESNAYNYRYIPTEKLTDSVYLEVIKDEPSIITSILEDRVKYLKKDVQFLDITFVLKAIKVNPKCFPYLSGTHKKRSDICLLALKKDPNNICYVSNKWLNGHPSFYLSALHKDPNNIKYVPKEWLGEQPELCITLLKIDFCYIKWMPSHIQEVSKHICVSGISKQPEYIKMLCPALLMDSEIQTAIETLLINRRITLKNIPKEALTKRMYTIGYENQEIQVQDIPSHVIGALDNQYTDTTSDVLRKAMKVYEGREANKDLLNNWIKEIASAYYSGDYEFIENEILPSILAGECDETNYSILDIIYNGEAPNQDEIIETNFKFEDYYLHNFNINGFQFVMSVQVESRWRSSNYPTFEEEGINETNKFIFTFDIKNLHTPDVKLYKATSFEC